MMPERESRIKQAGDGETPRQLFYMNQVPRNMVGKYIEVGEQLGLAVITKRSGKYTRKGRRFSLTKGLTLVQIKFENLGQLNQYFRLMWGLEELVGE